MTHSQNTGNFGENLAQHFLEEKGYLIIDTQWKSRFGELDIIAIHNNIYVFVEVKTRHSNNTEVALASITPSKREKILKAIYLYLDEHNLDDTITWRVDAIAVALSKNHAPIIDHVEDAFDW